MLVNYSVIQVYLYGEVRRRTGGKGGEGGGNDTTYSEQLISQDTKTLFYLYLPDSLFPSMGYQPYFGQLS